MIRALGLSYNLKYQPAKKIIFVFLLLTLVSSVPTITFVTNNNVNFAFASSDDSGGSSSDDSGGNKVAVATIAVVAVATIAVVAVATIAVVAVATIAVVAVATIAVVAVATIAVVAVATIAVVLRQPHQLLTTAAILQQLQQITRLHLRKHVLMVQYPDLTVCVHPQQHRHLYLQQSIVLRTLTMLRVLGLQHLQPNKTLLQTPLLNQDVHCNQQLLMVIV